MLIKKVLKFFDKLEDKVRGKLIHYPILYAFIAGVGIVLFWRGVWHTADYINLESISSIIIGSVILLMTGIFVSDFIGNRLIASDLIDEKKLTKEEERQIATEENQLQSLGEALHRVEKKLDHLEKDITHDT